MVKRPSGKFKKEEISDLLDSSAMISMGSPVAAELDDRRINQGYSVDDEVNLNEKIDEYHTLLNDDKSPIISNFIHAMDYKNGANIA